MNKGIMMSAALLALVFTCYLNFHPQVESAPLMRVMLSAIWLPTAIMAMFTGALFASSGLLIQTTLDNDFASPSTIGITAGALFGVIVTKLLFPFPSSYLLWSGAFIGAFSLALLVLGTTRLVGGGRLPMVLIGMALGLGFGAIGSVFMVYFENEMDGLFLWGSGQVLQTSSSLIQTLFPLLSLCLLSGLLVLPKLALFVLGDTQAQSLGLAVTRWRWIILFIAIAQASFATALVGMVGFVGLMAPHIAKYLTLLDKKQQRDTNPQSGSLFPLWCQTLLIGALLVLCAEWASRSFLFLGYRLPTGAFTALLGAPFFIFLLIRQRARALAETEKQGLSLQPVIQLQQGPTLLMLLILLIITTWYWLPTNELIEAAKGWESQRVLLAGLSGFSLAIAGTLLQTLFRNPMASPDISGVSAMAILAIAILLVLFPAAPQSYLFLAGLVGAAAVLLLLIWGFKQQLSVSQIALIGITITAFTGTLTHILLTFGSSTSSITLLWLIGTTYAASSEQTLPLAITLVIALAALLPYLRDLDILPLGELIPNALGIPVTRRNIFLLGIAATLTAISVSSVGAISFVGLLAPHCARLIGLYQHQYLLPAAGLIGATLLIWADGIGRTLLSPNEIAAGMVVSILGSSYFLLLLLIGYRKNQERII